jgi:putative ABC transport system permease protein
MRVRTLDRKLLRELRRSWVQVVSIALVMACGTMTIMGLRSTLASVRRARDAYYAEYRFGDVFAQARRVPRAVAPRLAAIAGVAAVETRITEDVKLDVPGLPEPAIGHMVSVPDAGRPLLNRLHLRAGRWNAPHRADEVLVSDRFAELNGLRPGDSLAAVINGRWQRLHIVGLALAPDFVVEYAGAAMIPDNRRYGVLWTSAQGIETAFDMKGAFNDVVIRLSPGAREAAVIAAVDAVLAPWGTRGAYGRADQPAARVLDDEFKQLGVNATVFPMFFLVVAAFLLNVVLSRVVASQRDEIAALKAFGFTDREIGAHYLSFAVVAVVLGAALGLPLGLWMGAAFTSLYTDYFRFPSMPALVDWSAAAASVFISGGCALLGALGAVRRVMRLAPAEALRPEAPARFRPLLVEQLGLGRFIAPSARMVLRNLERRPFRTVSTVVGVALAVALLATGQYPFDAFDRLFAIEFGVANRYDLVAGFTQRTERRAVTELRHVAGVVAVEPVRSAAVRVTARAERRTTTLTALAPGARLVRIADEQGDVRAMPPDGVVINRFLAQRFGLRRDDTLTVELIEQGVSRRIGVAGVVDALMDQGMYMSSDAFRALVREDVVSAAYLAVAPGQERAVVEALKRMPGIAAVESRAVFMRNLEEQIRQSMTFVLGLIVASASVIAIGVVYNSARIALAERGRELASLRVLGFTTPEVSRMLLGEQAAILVVAIPAGLLIGAGFSRLLASAFASDRFRFPFVVALDSDVISATVVVAAAVIAGGIVHRRIKRLDMVSALRTRE